jgi:surfeit locus 1 family protein
MWSLARTPRWIGALLLALALAAAFAFLGHWQLDRSIQSATVVTRPTETVVPLDSVAKPQSGVSNTADGQLITVTGSWVANDYTTLSGRLNDGSTGYWVVGQLHTTTTDATGAGLAVALGWAPTKAAAASALAAMPTTTAVQTITGRYLASEGPQDDDFEHGAESSMAVPALINEWKTVPSTVYGGYVVSETPAQGLTKIDSPAPGSETTLNWLNIFYAVEWVVFAGLAVFLWFRLLKDAFERQQEEAAELAAELN